MLTGGVAPAAALLIGGSTTPAAAPYMTDSTIPAIGPYIRGVRIVKKKHYRKKPSDLAI